MVGIDPIIFLILLTDLALKGMAVAWGDSRAAKIHSNPSAQSTNKSQRTLLKTSSMACSISFKA